MTSTTKKVLLYSIITLIYAVFFTPLIVSTSLFFPYITGKAFTFRLLVQIATTLYIVLALFDRSYWPRKGMVLASVVGFTAVLGLSTLTAEDPSKSFWSNFERMEGYVTIVHLSFFFLVTSTVFRTKKAWYALINTSLAISVVLGLRAFADYDISRSSPFIVEFFKGIKYFFLSLFGKTSETVRIAGPLGNSSYLGVYSLLHAFFAGLVLVTLASQKKFREARFKHILYIAIALFNIIVLYNTGTRGSFVGLVAGVFVTALIPLGFIIFKKTNIQEQSIKTIKKVSAVFLIAVLLIVGLLGANKQSDFVQSSSLLSRFSSLITFDIKGVLETQGKARTLLWGMAYEGVKERPLLGWGQDNFTYVFAKFYDPKMYAQEQWFDRTHNVFFDWLIAGGLLGLLGYLSLFFAIVYVLWKKTTLNTTDMIYDILEKSVLTGLLVAYFIHNVFIFDNLTSYILFFVLLAYVQHMSTAGDDTSKRIQKTETFFDVPAVRTTALIIIVLLFGFVVHGAVYKPYMAGRTLITALLRAQPEAAKYLGEQDASPERVLELFKKALAYDTFANTEIRERLAEVTPTILNGNKDAELITAYTSLVATEYQNAIKDTPKDPRPYIFLSMYLQKFGLMKESEIYIDQAIALSPTKQSFLYQKGIIQVSLKQYPEAVETFKKAYELETTSKESRVLYALALIYADKFAEAKTILADDVSVYTDQRILEALLEKKMYNQIIEIAQMKITADPTDPQAHMSLAGLYLQMNRREEAIAEIRTVMKLSPEFAQTGEFYISEIRAGRDPSRPAVKQ